MDYEDMLMKLIKGEPFTDEDIEGVLYEMCDDIHASCDNSCVMMAKGLISHDSIKLTGNCPYFKNGKAMLIALRNLKEVKEAKKS